MPATSLESLFDIQAKAETAIAAYLTANGIASYATRSTENLPDSRVIVQVEVGAAQGHQATYTLTHTGENEQDWFSLVVGFQIQTERSIVAASPDESIANIHDYMVARCKVLMLRGALNGTITGITALSLPLYNIAVLSYSGDQYTVTDEGIDTTSIRYAGQIQIMADAWPT